MADNPLRLHRFDCNCRTCRPLLRGIGLAWPLLAIASAPLIAILILIF